MAESEVPHRGAPPPNDALSAARVAFPQTPEDFDSDPRVSFSKLDSKWILEDDDGSEWEWNDVAKRWMPSLDEALLEQQREAYAVAGESETVAPAQEKKKRKKNENVRVTAPNSNPHLAEIGYTILTEFETIQDSAGNSKKQRQNDQPKAERKNTAVYVTSLPLDVTVDELNSTFSKYGVIAEEIDSGGPRIKLYQDENGKPKGDALIVYFRPESVQLAIQMLDDSDFRLGQEGPMGKMRVKEADWSYKKQKEAGGADNGDKQTSKEKRDKAREKQKIIKRTQKLNSKLADWDDDDPSALPDTSSRWDKVVILKHMFTLKELEDDPAALLDIKEDIRDECSKLGEVTNVVLFDKETDGVATVRFANPQAAEACIRMMSGRMFGGKAVEAYTATGNEKFKKTREKKVAWEDDDDEGGEESKRLDEFGEWLEQGGEGDGEGGGEELR